MGKARTFAGDVDLLGLGNLVQLLNMNRCEGMLVVTKGRDRQAVHLGPGGIRLVSSTVPRVKRLGKLVRRVLGRTTIAPAWLRQVLKKEKLLGWTLGQFALSDAPVKMEDIETALRQQVEEEVLDLFVWTQATLKYEEGRLPRAKAKEPLAGLTLRTDATSLLIEAARRADEVVRMRQVLTHDELKILKVPREIHADELGEDVGRVDAILPLINGRRSLKAILQASIYPKFATMRAVHRLLTLGYAKARDREGNTVMRAAEPALASQGPPPAAPPEPQPAPSA
jgi:hypothetical protein